MKRLSLVIFFLFTLSVTARTEDLQTLINQLFETDMAEKQDTIISKILEENPSAYTIITLIRNITFPEPEKRGIVSSTNLCIDGKNRPFYWYIPQKYNPLQKTPLLVYLHGGVSRPEIIEEPEEYIKESPLLPLAETKGYIILFPLGQGGATWWDSVGVSNVLLQVRKTKKIFNIDDSRVYMTGFSDGGSGSFFFAMCQPTDFAAFLPLNGHPGVGSLDGGIQTYFSNLYNKPLSVINTDKDPLYPDRKMRPMMELAMEAGADLLYRIYTGIGHEFTYAKNEIPLMLKFMETHPRIQNPSVIKWETADNRWARCMWLSLDEVKLGKKAEWHKEYNMELIDDRVVFGFVPDDTHKGEGIKIGKVADSTFCAIAGAQPGDIIIEVGDDSVANMQVLNDYKAEKKRGDPAKITVLRDGKKLKFEGYFPPPKKYMLFRRDNPSAKAEATFYGNEFHIRSSQLGTFSIYIHPEMVQLDQNVEIYVNGKKVFDDRVTPDIEFMLRNFLINRDRHLLYVNKLLIESSDE
jgi:poly(3-hydroxybutyrate) depolymerase